MTYKIWSNPNPSRHPDVADIYRKLAFLAEQSGAIGAFEELERKILPAAEDLSLFIGCYRRPIENAIKEFNEAGGNALVVPPLLYIYGSSLRNHSTDLQRLFGDAGGLPK